MLFSTNVGKCSFIIRIWIIYWRCMLFVFICCYSNGMVFHQLRIGTVANRPTHCRPLVGEVWWCFGHSVLSIFSHLHSVLIVPTQNFPLSFYSCYSLNHKTGLYIAVCIMIAWFRQMLQLFWFEEIIDSFNLEYSCSSFPLLHDVTSEPHHRKNLLSMTH